MSQNKDSKIPLEDASVDLIHCSGVLHHAEDLLPILQEFRRIIKPSGYAQIMIYNYHSITVHLYVGWYLMGKNPLLNIRKLGIEEFLKRSLKRRFFGINGKTTLEDTFALVTDGKFCPISRFYKHDEFTKILNKAGFDSKYLGGAIHVGEMQRCLQQRFLALEDKNLPFEHREFLHNLTFDTRGVPHYSGYAAGIDGCYTASPI